MCSILGYHLQFAALNFTGRGRGGSGSRSIPRALKNGKVRLIPSYMSLVALYSAKLSTFTPEFRKFPGVTIQEGVPYHLITFIWKTHFKIQYFGILDDHIYFPVAVSWGSTNWHVDLVLSTKLQFIITPHSRQKQRYCHTVKGYVLSGYC